MGFIEHYIMNGRPMYKASERGLAFLRQYYVLLSTFLVSEDEARQPAIIYPSSLKQ
jgi:hypothetical protein